MQVFNSLTRKKEEFRPLDDKQVGMYTCGPTVYDFLTIGNWRTYTFADLMYRTLKYFGYLVEYVMNITDVGHLVSDADEGEDKLEKGARREGKTAWEVARFYTDDFLAGFEKLNLIKPRVFSKATDHIQEQIDLLKQIEERGFSYKTSDGIYFNTEAYERAGNTYGELSTLAEIKEGARVEANPEKRNPRDFALWKFSPKGEKRDMEWESPWGMGFPGWHIECSAMSMKYLGEQFDLHLGGEDLKSTHHPNEIAQSEAASGEKPFVKYWMHGAFLLVDGGRMGKSLGNAYRLSDLEGKGFSPLDLRYFYLTGHYRKQLNFTFEALQAAKEARAKLTSHMQAFGKTGERTTLHEDKLKKIDDYRARFRRSLEDDLNLPQALAIVWEVVKSNIADYDKYELILSFDEVLGLRLGESGRDEKIPDKVQKLVVEREKLRAEKSFEEADEVRREIEKLGYEVEDLEEGSRVLKK